MQSARMLRMALHKRMEPIRLDAATLALLLSDAFMRDARGLSDAAELTGPEWPTKEDALPQLGGRSPDGDGERPVG